MSVELVAGRYELGDRLGHGGMSTVRRATDRRLRREVAVKLLAEHLADDASFVERFRREAVAAARLVHPNIVAVFDFGFDDASGRHYIVMEHVSGQSGAELLRDRGQLPVAEALAIISDACRGLDYAHRNGVVHRDVKPGNLLASEDGIVKLADFGIAKAIGDGSAITRAGSVLGTAAYLAPEQAHGEEAGSAADIYSLGVVSYQLLSGQLPYEATSLTELVTLQQQQAPALLDELVDEIPSAVSAAVDRALALTPDERFATAEELRLALAGAAAQPAAHAAATRRAAASDAHTRVLSPATRSTSAATAAAPAAARRLEPRPPRHPQASPATATPSRPRRGRVAVRVMLLLLVAAVGVAAAALAVNSSSDQPQRQVTLREVSGSGVPDTVDRLKRLVDDNTR